MTKIALTINCKNLNRLGIKGDSVVKGTRS